MGTLHPCSFLTIQLVEFHSHYILPTKAQAMRTQTASQRILHNYVPATRALSLFTAICLVIAFINLPISFTDRMVQLEEEVLEAMMMEPMIPAPAKKTAPPPAEPLQPSHQVDPVIDPPAIDPQPVIKITDPTMITDVPIDVPIDIPIETPIEKPMEPMLFPAVKPVFPGGEQALLAFLGSTKFPELARDLGIEGKVYIEFVLNDKGQVTSAAVVRSPHESLSQVALDKVLSMPDWTPGRSGGRDVPVRMTVPFNFKLQP